MPDSPQYQEVLAGSGPDGLTWTLSARQFDDNDFRTRLVRAKGDQRASSSFGGPKLPTGFPVNVWVGEKKGTPPFVMMRVSPDVDAVIAVNTDGVEKMITLSDVVVEFELKFGALALEAAERLVALRVRMKDGSTIEVQQRQMPLNETK